MARRATCLILCSAVVTACGSATQRSGESAGTNTGPAVSTQSPSCLPRGTGLVSVLARPPAKGLSESSITEIATVQGLEFLVTVVNRGCVSEKQIGVTLSIPGGGQRLSAEGRIAQINPGEKRSVVLGHLGLPDLQKKLLVRVEVEPVPGEVKTNDNSAAYPVIFVLGR